MSLSYEEVQTNLYQVEFDEVDKYALDEFFGYLNEMKFIQNHEVFYPKGIFTEKGINCYYFFTNNNIIKVSFGSIPEVHYLNYKQVKSYKLKYLNHFDLELEIILENEQNITLNSEKDTNEHRNVTMKNKINSILNLLINKY